MDHGLVGGAARPCSGMDDCSRPRRQGIGRSLRENLSLFTMFKNKQPKQYEAIKEEIGSVVDMDRFDKAYHYATAEKYGSLTTDFKPKCDTLTFRKNLNEAIIFE